jgi:ectoine hydroxylase-related dioxygenase (phytanoyl-CoA dioxygenase family)
MQAGALNSPARPLPRASDDLGRACQDIEAHGIALMSGVLPPADIDEGRAMVMSLAESERSEGCALIAGGRQRIFGLIQKAPVFRRIVTHPALLKVVHQILGPRIMLYSAQAHIVPEGGDMDPHFDQGEFTPFVPFTCVAAVVVMLDDFTTENGATRIALGHEARSVDEAPPEPGEMTPLVGPKGTFAAYGGLLWHSTGINRTEVPRCGLLVHYCLPWVRAHENYQRTISTAMARAFSPELRQLLGIHDHLIGRRWLPSSAEFRSRIPSGD